MARELPEWIGTTDSSPVPDRVRLRVFERANGCCQKCTRRLRPSHWDTDHIKALINGGINRESNLQALCNDPCHASKTKTDVAEKAATYKHRKSSAGLRRPRTITRWRRMNGTPVYAARER